MSEQLTIEQISAYVDEIGDESSLADRLTMQLSPESRKLTVHAPVDIYRFLLSQLATITEERDKLKLQLAGRTYCHSDEQINKDLVAAEEALDKMMTLNDKLTGEVDRLRRLISEAIEAINPNIIDNLLFEAINPHQYALLQPDALEATK